MSFTYGILGGVVGYGSLGAVDRHFNISGTHGFASAMSPEDAVWYEDFLKNESQEGLTEAEVKGIAKVDQVTILKIYKRCFTTGMARNR